MSVLGLKMKYIDSAHMSSAEQTLLLGEIRPSANSMYTHYVAAGELTVNMYDDESSVVARLWDCPVPASLALARYVSLGVFWRQFVGHDCARGALAGSQITSIYGKLDHKSSARERLAQRRVLGETVSLWGSRTSVVGVCAVPTDTVTLRATAKMRND